MLFSSRTIDLMGKRDIFFNMGHRSLYWTYFVTRQIQSMTVFSNNRWNISTSRCFLHLLFADETVKTASFHENIKEKNYIWCISCIVVAFTIIERVISSDLQQRMGEAVNSFCQKKSPWIHDVELGSRTFNLVTWQERILSNTEGSRLGSPQPEFVFRFLLEK